MKRFVNVMLLRFVISFMIKKILIILSLGIILLIPFQVRAAKSLSDSGGALTKIASRSGIDESNISTITGTVVTSALGVVGLVFLILMVYAGMIWMIARGDETQVTKAKNTIIAAVIGLVVTVGAYALTNFITDRIIDGELTTGGGGNSVDLDDSGPKGCCTNWVAVDNVVMPSLSCEMYTEAYCKILGETVTQRDVRACAGPQRGCWVWRLGECLPECRIP